MPKAEKKGKSEQRATNPIFNKDLGQHILKNPAIAKAIVEKARLRSSDTVLEIGPGTGNVTMHILENSKKTIVVEMDARLAAELAKRVRGTPEQRKLHIVVGGNIAGTLITPTRPYRLFKGGFTLFRCLYLQHAVPNIITIDL